MVASYLGVGTDLLELRRKFPTSPRGATLKNITALCDALKLTTRAVKCRVAELGQLRAPCLLHWRFNHFVVLKSVHHDRIVIHDPARGAVTESYDEVVNAFTGVALEVSRAPDFKKSRKPPQLRLSGLAMWDAVIGRQLLAGLVLTLICEVLFLASPFYLQIVIDQVLLKGDHLLLNTLAIGFMMLLIFQVMANTMRQLTFQYLSQVTVFDLTARVLNRILRLPLTYFRARDLGDIQHRVQSLRRVQDFIVYSAPAIVLDALFLVLITGLMVLYDYRMTGLAIAAALVWSSWRLATFQFRVRISGDIAISESSVQTHFLETLREIQTIKMVNGEAVRQSDWRDLFADAINLKIRAGNLLVVDNALRQLLFQGVFVITVYVLAQRGLKGHMSIGMISAFAAYLGMFQARAGAIVDRVLEYKLLDVPLNRLADIVFNDEEADGSRGQLKSDVACGVDLSHVEFRYTTEQPWILTDCSCQIPENGFTAITGVSGTGKTTLLRVIAGLETHSAGRVLVGGVPISDWHTRDLRQNLAAVFQDDGLLKGSIAENIAVFEKRIEMSRVRQAARNACIAEEIESLPMGYETRIGDLGSSLSKGQTQRILLARAYYRRPRLLLLDEVTGGLDNATEKRVINALVRRRMTRIVITHSDLMLQAAHDVLWLHEGSLLSSRPELNV